VANRCKELSAKTAFFMCSCDPVSVNATVHKLLPVSLSAEVSMGKLFCPTSVGNRSHGKPHVMS
jgi:hypothetical protein